MGPADRDRNESELAAFIRENVKPRGRRKSKAGDAPPSSAITVTGNHHVEVIHVGRDLRILRASKLNGRRSNAAAAPPAAKRNGASQRESWREAVIGLIQHRIWDLNLSEEHFCELASKKLGKHVTSFAKLSERELGRLYEIAASLRRPAIGK